jgi:hypothetical protein
VSAGTSMSPAVIGMCTMGSGQNQAPTCVSVSSHASGSGSGSASCVSDPTYNIGYGACGTYAVGGPNHGSCTIHPGASMACCECSVFGCTNSTAENYNANATVDDGSCYACWEGQVVPLCRLQNVTHHSNLSSVQIDCMCRLDVTAQCGPAQQTQFVAERSRFGVQCPPRTCLLPTAEQTGYSYRVNGQMVCSGLTDGNISCQVQPSCARGYYGNPTNQDHSCATNGSQLTLGGCSRCPSGNGNTGGSPHGMGSAYPNVASTVQTAYLGMQQFCVCRNTSTLNCLGTLDCWAC